MTKMWILTTTLVVACSDKGDDSAPGDDGIGDDSGTLAGEDADKDGFDSGDDCNDGDPAVNPDATEVCDGIDNDCDGDTDLDATDATAYYTDADADTYGDGTATLSCTPVKGASTRDGDCDDSSSAVHPAAAEVCNDKDDDCDKVADEDATDATDWYYDADADGYGTGAAVHACDPPEDYAASDADCNDANAAINPDAFDVCEDGVDDDCTGTDQPCRTEGTFGGADATAILRGQAGENLGWEVTKAGDVNGDGVDDFWANAYGAGPSSPDWTGVTSLIVGPISGESDIADSAYATLTGESSDDYTGHCLQGGDDLDGDGTPDIAVNGYGAGYNGTVYVVSGAAVSGDVSLADADGNVTDASGEVSNLGYDISTSPDVTGDGVGDVLIGSYGRASDKWTGAVWIMAGPISGAYDLTDAAAIISGNDAFDLAGIGVAGLSDVNGDGAYDLAVSAHGDDTAGDAAGAAGLFYGPIATDLALADADRLITGEAGGDELSRNAIGGRGDDDGDGIDDWMVGAQTNSTKAYYAGAAYLVLGDSSAAGTTSAADVAAQLYGESDAEFAGHSFDLGDVDGDGFADVAVSGYSDDATGTDAGTVSVFFGPVSGSYVLSDATLIYQGEAGGDYFGMSTVIIGDSNSDGDADVLIGAWGNDENGEMAGSVYLFP